MYMKSTIFVGITDIFVTIVFLVEEDAERNLNIGVCSHLQITHQLFSSRGW